MIKQEPPTCQNRRRTTGAKVFTRMSWHNSNVKWSSSEFYRGSRKLRSREPSTTIVDLIKSGEDKVYDSFVCDILL